METQKPLTMTAGKFFVFSLSGYANVCIIISRYYHHSNYIYLFSLITGNKNSHGIRINA